MSVALTSAIGVDYGTKFTGVAVSHGGFAPRPLRVLKTEHPWTKTANLVASIAIEEKVQGIVVGIPCYASGSIYDRKTDTVHGRRCRHFANYLAMYFKDSDQRVYLFDEFRTSRDAYRGIDSVLIEGDGLDVFSSMKLDRPRSKKQRAKSKRKGVDAKAAAMLLLRYFQDPELAIDMQF
eukprot:g1593.t1